MPVLTAAEVASVCSGRVVGDPDTPARRFGADSRTVEPGAGFLAVRSGHAHVADALRAGASFAVVEDPAALPPDGVGVVVADAVAALAALAREVRGRLPVRVVGVTGSTGKTLTKDFIAAALRCRYRVHAAPESYNNEVGVPLVVLSCPDDAEAIVVELGARHTGDIASLCEIARPHTAVITGIGITHLEIFGSREAIARTKSELLAALPADSLAVVPAHDDFLHVLSAACPAPMTTVGPGGHVRVLAAPLAADGRAEARITIDGQVVALHPRLPGRAIVRNAAMALTVAAAWGVDLSDAAHAISAAETSGLRLEVHETGGRTILNDAYNANPTSTSAALRTVEEMAGDRPKWAVLGAMAELGAAAPSEHLRIGRLAAALGYSTVIVVGEDAARIAEGAGERAHRVADPQSAARLVAAEAPDDAVVLVKGSRVVGLERAVALLLDGPSARLTRSAGEANG